MKLFIRSLWVPLVILLASSVHGGNLIINGQGSCGSAQSTSIDSAGNVTVTLDGNGMTCGGGGGGSGPTISVDIVNTSPGGNGTVTGAGGINCVTSSDTGTCSTQVTLGYDMQLTAVESGNAEFVSWSNCTPTNDPKVCNTGDVTETTPVTATFTGGDAPPAQHTLTVNATGGTGSAGTVTGTGISCVATGSGDCSETVNQGTSIILAANANGDTFMGWGGDAGTCGTASSCTVTMNSAKNVTANFDAQAGPEGCGTTPSNVNIINRSWPDLNSETVTMPNGQWTAVKITTTSDGSLKGQFAAVPTSTNGAWTTVAISSCPGDFSTELGTRCLDQGSETGINWKQSANQLFRCGLAPNTTYYINMGFRTSTDSGSTCNDPSGSCALIMQNYF